MRKAVGEGRRARRTGQALLLAWIATAILAAGAAAQQAAGEGAVTRDGMVQLDFNDVELSVVIDTIARLTGRNFIYDDRVRGRVTIVSPTEITVDEAYKVFESVLQVKGFTTVEAPGGVVKVIPIREAKESSVETSEGRARPPTTDRFITRLIPLRYIDAEDITNTLKPLVSKDASMVAYAPTNTVILTDAASNIARILEILRSIDVETYKEELTVLKVRHADATTLADQLSEIFGAEVGAADSATQVRRRVRAARQQIEGTVEPASRGRVRILTDERTNSLVILASRQRTEEIRDVVRRLDLPVTGGGRIHVYYLKHADSEELAETLQALISGQSVQPAGGAAPGANGTGGVAQALRAAVTELSEGVTLTADAPTNSLVIQSSQEGFSTLSAVIDRLDIPRPQVLVEALIMEVDVSNGRDLGFNGLARIFRGKTNYAIGSLTDSGSRGTILNSARGTLRDTDGDGTPDETGGVGDIVGNLTDTALSSLLAAASRNTLGPIDPDTGLPSSGSLIQGIIRASASESGTNILSAPHILTLDNEEAEIKVGANIPIVTSRVQSAAGIETTGGQLATSQNIERQDIGITLRVTPQISEGNNLRLKIFQEITDVNAALSGITGDPQEVGVSLSNRTVENAVTVSDSETVVIGGLISDDYEDTVTKVPWLGDIPVLGWLFKSTTRQLQKSNLLIFLTPHIIRTALDLEYETIRKREEFWDRSQEGVQLSEKEQKEQDERRRRAAEAGIEFHPVKGKRPVRARLLEHTDRYPLERMREIEEQLERERAEARESAARAERGLRYQLIGATFRDENAAATTLQEVLDAGYEATIVSGDVDGEVLYELRVGPFSSLEAAEKGAAVLRESFGLAPQVTVEPEER